MSETSRQPSRARERPTSSTSAVDSSDCRAGPAREPQCAHGWSHFIVSSQTALSGFGTLPSSGRRFRTGAGCRPITGAYLPPAPPVPPVPVAPAAPPEPELASVLLAATV